MPGPDEIRSGKIHMVHGFGDLEQVRQEEAKRALNGAEIDALRVSGGVRASDGYGSFSEAMGRLISHNKEAHRTSVFEWARKLLSRKTSVDLKPENLDVQLDVRGLKRFAEFYSQKAQQEVTAAIAAPVERANPLAHAALAAYQQHVAAMPQAPQIMVQSAAVMVSPVTGMPAGLVGIHI